MTKPAPRAQGILVISLNSKWNLYNDMSVENNNFKEGTILFTSTDNSQFLCWRYVQTILFRNIPKKYLDLALNKKRADA